MRDYGLQFEVPVGEEGEVLACGVKVMKGYLNKPEETAKALREIDGEIWHKAINVGDDKSMSFDWKPMEAE